MEVVQSFSSQSSWAERLGLEHSRSVPASLPMCTHDFIALVHFVLETKSSLNLIILSFSEDFERNHQLRSTTFPQGSHFYSLPTCLLKKLEALELSLELSRCLRILWRGGELTITVQVASERTCLPLALYEQGSSEDSVFVGGRELTSSPSSLHCQKLLYYSFLSFSHFLFVLVCSVK